MTLPDGRPLGHDDPTDLAGLLRNDYRGCRYAFGYSACPDLEDRAKSVDLIGSERIGVELRPTSWPRPLQVSGREARGSGQAGRALESDPRRAPGCERPLPALPHRRPVS
ncbi:vitamin B12 dependent-methionine synthase activation domain-containing protein [Micromonospora zamorensis]